VLTPSQWGNLMVWLAANTVLSTFGLGVLGPLVFYMNLGDSMYAKPHPNSSAL
jgi:purine-cytosine permease-like protein